VNTKKNAEALQGFSDAMANNVSSHNNSSKNQEGILTHDFVDKKSHMPSIESPSVDLDLQSHKNITSIWKYIDKDIDDSHYGGFDKGNRSKAIYYGESHMENQELSLSHLRHSRIGKNSQIFIEEENDMFTINSEVDNISEQVQIRESQKAIPGANELSIDKDESSMDNNSSIFG
jgi:hypothetical protein